MSSEEAEERFIQWDDVMKARWFELIEFWKWVKLWLPRVTFWLRALVITLCAGLVLFVVGTVFVCCALHEAGKRVADTMYALYNK